MGNSIEQWRIVCSAFCFRMSGAKWKSSSRGIGKFTSRRKMKAFLKHQREALEYFSCASWISSVISIIAAIIVMSILVCGRLQQKTSDGTRKIITDELFAMLGDLMGVGITLPMSALLIALLLFMSGVEKNPGPGVKNCKGHGNRKKVDKELTDRKIRHPGPKYIRDRRVFKVSEGPVVNMWSLIDFENKFEKSNEWVRMKQDVWMVPRMNLFNLFKNEDNPKGRLPSHITMDDMEEEFQYIYESKVKSLIGNIPEEEKQEMTKEDLEARVKEEAIEAVEKLPKFNLYKNRLGDEAEMMLMSVFELALEGIPSLILRGVKTFEGFPKTIVKAGIKFSQRSEHDIVILFPKEDVLCIRYIQVKRQVIMPWETTAGKINPNLIIGMYKQLLKDIQSFDELFPDFKPQDVDIQVFGALPFSSADDLFCTKCTEKTFTSEDCNGEDSKAKVRSKLGIDDTNPSDYGMDLYKIAAARFISGFSLVHKTMRNLGDGFKEGFSRLSDVTEVMKDHFSISDYFETGILLSEEQREASLGEFTSACIHGLFGSGKTEVAKAMSKNFINKIRDESRKGLVIVSLFSERGYCDRIMSEYNSLLSKFQDISRMVCKRNWLLKRLGVAETTPWGWSYAVADVINKMMKRLVERHPNCKILLILEEVEYWNPKNKSSDWSNIKIPPGLTLVACMKPLIKNQENSNFLFFAPPEQEMEQIFLTRLYRSCKKIIEFLEVLSIYLTHGYALLPVIYGHDIPGDTTQWFHIKGDHRDEPDPKELSQILEIISEELKECKIEFDNVALIIGDGDILMNIRREVKVPFQNIFHVQSFMGCEAPVVICVMSANVTDRQLECLSRAMMRLYIITCDGYFKSVFQEIKECFPELIKQRSTIEEDAVVVTQNKEAHGNSIQNLKELLDFSFGTNLPKNKNDATKSNAPIKHRSGDTIGTNNNTSYNICNDYLRNLVDEVLDHVENNVRPPSKMMERGKEIKFNINTGRPQHRIAAYVCPGDVPLHVYSESEGWTIPDREEVEQVSSKNHHSCSPLSPCSRFCPAMDPGWENLQRRFFWACEYNQINILKDIVTRFPWLMQLNTEHAEQSQRSYIKNNNALHVACFKGNLEVARFLLDEGIDINMTTAEGETALHFAIRGDDPDGHHGYPACVELLLNRGVPVNKSTKNGNTALHLAVYWNRQEILELLLLHPDIDGTLKNCYGHSANQLALYLHGGILAKFATRMKMFSLHK